MLHVALHRAWTLYLLAVIIAGIDRRVQDQFVGFDTIAS